MRARCRVALCRRLPGRSLPSLFRRERFARIGSWYLIWDSPHRLPRSDDLRMTRLVHKTPLNKENRPTTQLRASDFANCPSRRHLNKKMCQHICRPTPGVGVLTNPRPHAPKFVRSIRDPTSLRTHHAVKTG